MSIYIKNFFFGFKSENKYHYRINKEIICSLSIRNISFLVSKHGNSFPNLDCSKQAFYDLSQSCCNKVAFTDLQCYRYMRVVVPLHSVLEQRTNSCKNRTQNNIQLTRNCQICNMLLIFRREKEGFNFRLQNCSFETKNIKQ